VRVILCASIIFASVLASETSPYGFILAALLLGLIFAILVTLVGFLAKAVGESNRSITLIIIALSPFIATTIYFFAFGKYLNGGTMFLRTYPLIENGYTTVFGFLFVFFYTLVLVGTLLIAKAGKKNG